LMPTPPSPRCLGNFFPGAPLWQPKGQPKWELYPRGRWVTHCPCCRNRLYSRVQIDVAVRAEKRLKH
jgi:hypothetical protein